MGISWEFRWFQDCQFPSEVLGISSMSFAWCIHFAVASWTALGNFAPVPATPPYESMGKSGNFTYFGPYNDYNGARRMG